MSKWNTMFYRKEKGDVVQWVAESEFENMIDMSDKITGVNFAVSDTNFVFF